MGAAATGVPLLSLGTQEYIPPSAGRLRADLVTLEHSEVLPKQIFVGRRS